METTCCLYGNVSYILPVLLLLQKAVVLLMHALIFWLADLWKVTHLFLIENVTHARTPREETHSILLEKLLELLSLQSWEALNTFQVIHSRIWNIYIESINAYK